MPWKCVPHGIKKYIYIIVFHIKICPGAIQKSNGLKVICVYISNLKIPWKIWFSWYPPRFIFLSKKPIVKFRPHQMTSMPQRASQPSRESARIQIIIQSITSSEMCSLHLTHPSTHTHTHTAVDTVHSGNAPARPPHVTFNKIHLFETR